jgi:acyl dehydratase
VASLDQLTDLVGEEIGVGDWMTVTQERIDLFAEATGDYQWIHVDEEQAAAGPFGSTIAHGFLTLSLLPAIGVSVDVPDAKLMLNYGLDRVRFISPVRVGCRLRVRSRLLEVSEVDGGFQLKTEMTVEMEGSDRPACVAETITRVVV